MLLPNWILRLLLIGATFTGVCAQALKPPPQDYVLRFDSNSVAYAPQISVTASFTMEAWVYLDTITPGPLIMGRANNPRDVNPWQLYALGLDVDRPTPTFQQSTGQAGTNRLLAGPSALPLFRWTHVAATVDAGVMRLYVNGVEAASGASPGPVPSSLGPFSLGGVIGDVAEPSCGCSFNGAMREARLWSRALSSAELRTYATQTLTGTEPGLIADWPLSDGAGTLARGIGQQAAPLTIRGKTVWANTRVMEGEPYWEVQELPPLTTNTVYGSSPGLFLNSDRRPDIAVIFSPPGTDPNNNNSGPVLFLHNEGNRKFTPVVPAQPVMTRGVRQTVAADFDRDGLEDLVLGDSGWDVHPWPGGLTRILMQRSGGMLDETSSRLTQEVATTHDICAADVDKNGASDLLYAATTGTAPLRGPKLFLNNGSGYFTEANRRMPPILQPRIIDIDQPFLSCWFADVNLDGWPDLLLGSGRGDLQSRDWLLLNDGKGSFLDVTSQSMPLKRGGNDFVTIGFGVADFNRDGWPDVVASLSNLTTTYMQLLMNKGDGTFREQPDPVLNLVRAISPYFDRLYPADLNNDGWVDLIASEGGLGSTMHMYQNMGGRFEDRTATLNHGLSFFNQPIPADFDQDGRTDILLLTNTQTRIAWGKNLWPPVAVATPVVTSAITAGGSPGIAQNGWIEIRGTNLSPLSVPANGMDWSAAKTFPFGEMPTELGGVSVTINGKPAFVYYASPTQVNVLAPLDNTLGGVDIVVTSGGRSSTPFRANKTAVAPSFPLVGANYIVATHANYSLVGPTSMSSPGYAFTPAKPGETILMFAFGFGLPTTTLVNGASSQSGPLPALPSVTFGGSPATVQYAGVISPGLYQLNVVVPDGAANGDNTVTVTYGGATAPPGLKIAVER